MKTSLAEIKGDLAFINLAQQSGRQFWLSSKNQKAADRLLLFMLSQHGTQVLSRFASTNFQQTRPALSRLRLNNLTLSDNLPDYSHDGCNKALSILPRIQRSTGTAEAADYRVLQKSAFEQIDLLPAFAKFQAVAAEISARLPLLQSLCAAVEAEYLEQEASEQSRKHAREIQKSLAEIQPGDLLAAKELLVEMKKVLQTVRDQDTARQLQLRIRIYEGALELFAGRLHAYLRNVLSEILMREALEASAISRILDGDNSAYSSTMTAAEALVALAIAAPLTVSGIAVAPGAAYTAAELTREGRQWLDPSPEDKLLSELHRGLEYFDEKQGRVQRIILSELAGDYSRQYAADLAVAITCMGSAALLSKAISKKGQEWFATILRTRGASYGALADSLRKAESVFGQGPSFIAWYFNESSRHSNFLNNEETSEETVIALMEGEYDRAAAILPSLARCSLLGISNIPKNKFTEFVLRHEDYERAHELLNLQLTQLYNDGYTLRMKGGARFDAIDARGRVTEFRPSPELSAVLQNYNAPAWVTSARAKPVITQISLGELGESLLVSDAKTRQDENLFAQKNIAAHATPEYLASLAKRLPEISETAVIEYKRRMQECKQSWTEDLAGDYHCLRRIEPELQDSAVVLEKVRAKYFADEELNNLAQQELSHQKGWFRKPLSERLTAIEHKVLEKAEALEQNAEHPLGKARQEFERLRQEYEAIKLRLERGSGERKRDLQNVLAHMRDQHGWPAIELDTRWDFSRATENYQFGVAKLVLPVECLLDPEELDRKVFHDMLHRFQDRNLAEYALSRTKSVVDQAALYYEKLTSRLPIEDIFTDAATKHVRQFYTQQDETRLREMADDLKLRRADLTVESEKLYLRIAFLEARLYSLQRDKAGKGLENLFTHFASPSTGKEFQKKLFHRTMPEEMQILFERWQTEKTFTHQQKDEARQQATEIIEAELESTRREYDELARSSYSVDNLEQEAIAAASDKYYDAISKSKPAPHSVTPFEAIQAMTAAGSRKGDSLHPESRGWEAVRKMYESKLQQGLMSPAQLKKILDLPIEDREALETILKSEGLTLSRDVFAKLLQLESKAFHNLSGVPPTICNRVLVPALELGLLNERRLDAVLNFPDTQRRVVMGFIEKTVKDKEHAFTAEHLGRFLALPPAGRADIAQALISTENSRALSTNEAALALSAPTRLASGKEFCDAAALVKALQKGILSAEQVKDFALLDENARSGIAALLGTNALNRETAGALIQKLQSGELSESNARDLGVARLVGWLPDGALEQVFKLDAALRNALFERLAAETPRGKQGGFSVPDFMERLGPLNEMRKQGVINEPTMRLLSTLHASDLLIFDLLNTQAERAVTERVAPESIQQMILLARAGKLTLESLEAYRLGIEMNWIDRSTLKTMLAQKSEHRLAAEAFLKLDPETFYSLAREGRYIAMAAQSNTLMAPARAVFPDMFPEEGQIAFNKPVGLDNSKELSKVFDEFSQQMEKENFEAAIHIIEDSESAKKHEIRFVEKRINLYDFNRVQILQALSSVIQTQGRIVGESLEGDARNAENAIFSVDPIIELAGNREFRLRDSDHICEDDEWRESTAQEKTFIEYVQNTEAGRAILGSTALVLMAAWAQKAVREKLHATMLAPSTESTEEQTEAQKAEAEALAAAYTPTLMYVRSLNASNFSGLERGSSEITFPSGMKVSVKMPEAKFKAIEETYNQYMTALSRTSKLEGDERERRMAELAWYFDMEFASALSWAGIRLGYSSQPYMKPLFDINLINNYRPKEHSERVPLKPIDLNTVQGLRQFLQENKKGKKLYLELAAIKRSGITPKFDPRPPSGRAAKINPQDVRKLTSQQKSAVALALLNDSSDAYERIYEPPQSGMLDAVLEMTVYKFGDGFVSHSVAAFNRAEEWTYLMIALNDGLPLSKGGRRVKELFADGEFSELSASRDLIIRSNDFMQTLREMGIDPEDSLWDEPGHFRMEVEERLARERPGESAFANAIRERRSRKAGASPEAVLQFERGEPITFNDEQYRLIGRHRRTKQALIMYDGIAREPAPTTMKVVTDEELQLSFRELISGNNMHYGSKDTNDESVYVLSINEKGEKILHTDSTLRYVPIKQIVAVKPGPSAETESDRKLARELRRQARDIFDNYKEYSIGVAGQQKPLPFRQIIVGRGQDAGIRVVDENNYIGTRHLQVLVNEDLVAVQDLNSKNGSFINGRRLKPYETVPLRTIDRVTLGGSDGFVVSLIYKPTDVSTAPEYKYFVGDKELLPGAEPLTIGRLATADAFVSDPTVSKIQATLRMTADGKVFIKDGGTRPSLNGLVINGEQVLPGAEIELSPGDKVATKTGVILPIRYDKKRSRFAMLAESGSGRVNIKDANLAGISVFLGVDPRHGVYALPKNNDSWLTKRANKYTGGNIFVIKAVKKAQTSDDDEDFDGSGTAGNSRQDVLLADSLMSEEAMEQSNQFALRHTFEDKLIDGWSNAGKGKTFDSDGSFEAQNRIACTVDRKRDPILHRVIEDSKRRFWHLSPELRARALNEYSRELLTPGHMTPEQVDRWYNQFSYDHSGQRILLGEFIKEGKGTGSHQAVLIKVLADEFGDMQCKLVRGLDGCHTWTTFMLGGREVIHDPRSRFISPVAGEKGALPHAIHWQPDRESSEGELDRQIFVKVGDAVTFDGTTGWKVSSYDTLSGDIVLCTDGSRSAASADLALANPARMLIAGEKYNIPREDGLLEHGQNAWTFEGINTDGTLKFTRSGVIEVQARLDQVRQRADRRQR